METMRDLYQSKDKLSKVKAKIPLWNTSEANKKGVEDFLLLIGCSDIRKLKYISILKKILEEYLIIDYKKAEKQDIARCVARIEEQGYSPETEKDYKRILKKFYKVLLGEDEHFPKCVKWVKAGTSKHKERKKEILTSEEIGQMIAASQVIRDKACIACGFESCCRPSEFLSVQLKDVIPIEQGFQINVSGKTGVRPIFLYESASYLADWLNQHPRKDEKTAYLWVQLTSNAYGEPLTLLGLNKLIKKIAKRAGIKKRVFSYMQRRSGITHKRGVLKVSDSALENYAGWVAGSGQLKVYSRLTGFECKDEIQKAYGVEPIKQNLQKKCKRCNAVISLSTQKYCSRCGSPADETQIIKTKEYDEILNALLSKPGVVEELKKVLLEMNHASS